MCEDTELGGVRACAGMVHKVSTYPSGDRRSGSKALHGTEHVERDLICERRNISLSNTAWITSNMDKVTAGTFCLRNLLATSATA